MKQLVLVISLAILSASAAESLNVSGIYPHLTVFNSDPKREKPEMEGGAWGGGALGREALEHDLHISCARSGQ